jgi:hypothetical protein
METNDYPTPSPVALARFRFFMNHLMMRKLFTDAELREYHKLSTTWTILFNAKHRGVELNETQLAFLDIKRKSMFQKRAGARDKKWGAFFGFRGPKSYQINR